MTGDVRGKFVSRFVTVLLVGMAFAASVAMVAQEERSLFVELPAMPVETAQVD